VEVLVGEAGRAEREISLGERWRRIGGVQGTGILPRLPAAEPRLPAME
jgi:hypothetical protein